MWIHLDYVRKEDDVSPLLFQKSPIPFKIPRIPVEVLFGTELNGIDKDAHYRHIRGFSCLSNQCQMAFMQVTHGRHETDAFPLLPARRLLLPASP